MRAREIFPNQASVVASGIELGVDEARVVLCVLSYLLGESRSTTRVELHATISGVVSMMRLDLEHFGEHLTAPFPDLPTTGWPGGETGFQVAGTTYLELEAAWRDARDRADDAALPLRWVTSFFPQRLWPAIATLIAWGPEMTRLRMEHAIAALARQPRQRTARRRPGTPALALGTLVNRVTGVWRLIASIIAVHHRIKTARHPVLRVDLVAAWVTKPPRPDPRQFGAVASNQNNNGPTVDAASKRLRELARDSRPGTSPSMYRRLRRVILFAIHALYGARATAVRQLRVRDYIPTFVWNDGTIGPALRTHPGKTWDRETPHYLPVPRELAEWIERWLTLTDRQPSDGEAPLFPAKKPRAGQPDTFLTQLGHYAAVAGTTTSLALLPKTDDPHDGWHPHAYRHLAVKLAVRAATQLKARDPGHLTHIHPDEFARAVVAHKLASDVTSIYRDLDRQELCQAVIPEMWQILYGDGALRKGPDPDRVLKARQNLDTISTAIDSLTRDARHHEAKAEHLAQRAHSSRDDQRKLALLLEATHHTATARAHRDELVSAHAHRLDAERDLDHALNAHVPIPDQLTDEDHAVLLATALGTPASKPNAVEVADRADELAVIDVAELFAVTPQAITRWIRNGPPSHRPTPWTEDAWHVYTAKHQRLKVSHINLDALTQEQLHRLHNLQERRARIDST